MENVAVRIRRRNTIEIAKYSDVYIKLKMKMRIIIKDRNLIVVSHSINDLAIERRRSVIKRRKISISISTYIKERRVKTITKNSFDLGSNLCIKVSF